MYGITRYGPPVVLPGVDNRQHAGMVDDGGHPRLLVKLSAEFGFRARCAMATLSATTGGSDGEESLIARYTHARPAAADDLPQPVAGDQPSFGVQRPPAGPAAAAPTPAARDTGSIATSQRCWTVERGPAGQQHGR